jgi:hypothetical protein
MGRKTKPAREISVPLGILILLPAPRIAGRTERVISCMGPSGWPGRRAGTAWE